MALTGLQIQKLLPKTNCKECGSNTCLAFAMKLAARKAAIAECPYASEEAKQILGAAYEPPVRTIKLGPEGALRLGGETVLYRHDKTFVSPTALAVNLDATAEPAALDRALEECAGYGIERVGELHRLDLVAVTQGAAAAAELVALVEKAWRKTGKPLVVRASEQAALEQAAAALAGSHSVLAPTTAELAEALVPAAREHGHALAVTAPDLNELAAVTERLRRAGFNDLVLELPTLSPAERFQTASIARRAAIKDSYKPLGYPFLRFIADADLATTAVEATGEICKYGGICVLPAFNAALLAALLTLRLNLFTDPQKPIQVEPKIYPIGEPTALSPVFLTTNFSLTFFLVSAEIENTGLSAWLVVPECEGMSVLTAWAAGKLNGATVAKFCAEVGLEAQVERRELIIPGYVAQISGELEEKMPGWTVLVGPQEAADLESFVKSRLQEL